MRSFIANSIENLVIKEFEDVKWKEISTEFPQLKIFSLKSVLKSVEENGCYYMANLKEADIYGFLAGIGKQENPLIEVSYASSWYNSNLGGIYLIGFDKINYELFAPIPQKK